MFNPCKNTCHLDKAKDMPSMKSSTSGSRERAHQNLDMGKLQKYDELDDNLEAHKFRLRKAYKP